MSHIDSNAYENPDIEEFVPVFLEEIRHKSLSEKFLLLISSLPIGA